MKFRVAAGNTLQALAFTDKKSAIEWAFNEVKDYNWDELNIWQLVCCVEAVDPARKVKIKELK